MKTTTKLIGILSALIVVILAVFLVTKFNSHESARVSTSSSPVKTVKKSSSSSSKAVKKDKKSAQSSSSAVSNEENDNQASAVAPKASSQEQAQAGTTDAGQVAEATTPASQVGGVEGGRGAWTATSGTLTLMRKHLYMLRQIKIAEQFLHFLQVMLIGINMKFYPMETGIVLLKMGNVIIFHIQM